MTDTWARLAWALPAVLLLGAGLMLVLRRVLGHLEPPAPRARLKLVESLRINEDTALHLLTADDRLALLLETRGQPSNLSFVPEPQRPLATTRFGWKTR